MRHLNDRVAVITGAASGIGKALAEEFAEHGAKLVLVDVDEKALIAAADELRQKGATLMAEHVDVAQSQEMNAMAQRVMAEYGAAHVLCNNAGVSVAGSSAWELDLEDWNYIVRVNLMGVVHGLRAFMPILLKQEEA